MWKLLNMNTAEAIKHENEVTGKTIYYLKVSNKKKEVLIVIGQTTYEKIKSLENEPDQMVHSQ